MERRREASTLWLWRRVGDETVDEEVELGGEVEGGRCVLMDGGEECLRSSLEISEMKE